MQIFCAEQFERNIIVVEFAKCFVDKACQLRGENVYSTGKDEEPYFEMHYVFGLPEKVTVVQVEDYYPF